MSTLPRLFLASLAVIAVAGCQQQNDAAFGQKVRAYLLENPEVLREAIQKLNEKDQQAAAKASSEALGKVRDQLERDERDFVANPDGRVTVVEFYDYRCGYCKTTAPEILKLIRDNPDVRFVFKEYPIFGDVSDEAAKLALTPAAKPKTLALYQGWMAEKALDQAALDRHLRAAGVDPAVARAQANDAAVQRHLLDNRALAQSLGINGTPTFVVGETLIPGADMAALRSAILAAKGPGGSGRG